MKVFILTEEGKGFTEEGHKIIVEGIKSNHPELDTSDITFISGAIVNKPEYLIHAIDKIPADEPFFVYESTSFSLDGFYFPADERQDAITILTYDFSDELRNALGIKGDITSWHRFLPSSYDGHGIEY
ncbi:hypothetical protein SAMN04487830_1379 [Pseudobutyrivibrio sp. OR37]|uniref:hypothetical protein n=1 Tax=Pseudobutyrivibrio sp. OR37 TaxID=1798186 RepID=UPI0008EB4240|nr:hypothetical protein [Pseudobutyrivibrio sp. OR37]SFI28087.1 hypothetical protein SAMN04487830_1379 [Pseudobutyrivibrio sp. OR37]